MVDLANSRSAGANLPRLSPSELAKFRIPLPPISEQRRIATILDHADSLRRKRRTGLAQLEELTQAIFLDMFGDPLTNPNGFPVMTMGQICEGMFRNGLSPSTSGTVHARVLTLSAVTGCGFDGSASKISTFNTPPPMEQSVSIHDLLICRGNGNLSLVGKGYFAPESMPDTTFPDTIIAARVNTNLCEKFFLQQVWNSRVVRSQIESAARTTNGTFKVNQSILGGISFPIPEREAQEQFADRAKHIESLKDKHRFHLAELDGLFASLQARAFRGEL